MPHIIAPFIMPPPYIMVFAFRSLQIGARAWLEKAAAWLIRKKHRPA
jgi:hypothetical protein